MTMPEAIKTCLRKYFVFSGRAPRAEFWWFWAVLVLAIAGLSALGLNSLVGILQLATFIPLLAVGWRRMHDAGNSGALLLAPLALMIASIYISLFAMMGPVAEEMAKIPVDPDMTVRELQAHQQKALEVAQNTRTGLFSFWTYIVLAAGAIWMIYLLARPSQETTNRFGPPYEATPRSENLT